MNVIEVSCSSELEGIGGEVFLVGEELVGDLEPVDLGYGLIDRS
jgi:hypothetical protein